MEPRHLESINSCERKVCLVPAPSTRRPSDLVTHPSQRTQGLSQWPNNGRDAYNFRSEAGLGSIIIDFLAKYCMPSRIQFTTGVSARACTDNEIAGDEPGDDDGRLRNASSCGYGRDAGGTANEPAADVDRPSHHEQVIFDP